MRVLNVGGGPVQIAPEYEGWDVDLLDIDPAANPTIEMDARDIMLLPPAEYDAVYCSNNLEHYYEHEVTGVLQGFYHVLTAEGYADVRVPDARSVIVAIVQRDLDLDSVLYQAPVGPIRVCDVLWGYQKQIQESGQPYYTHLTGFSRNLLGRALKVAGFEHILIGSSRYELRALAYKVKPDDKEKGN
jgi:hypothetical protein